MKSTFLKAFLVTVLLSLITISNAVQIEFHSFENPTRERLYLDLIAELRCVKCQNQNLAESNAELAKDMREKTYQMVVEGKNRDDVVSYMTARYGDFVLYKPPFKAKTLLLWIGPPLLLILSLFLLLKVVRNQNKTSTKALSEADLDSVRNVLKSKSD